MSDLPKDAVLRIVRFCWPHGQWFMDSSVTLVAFDRSPVHQAKGAAGYFDPALGSSVNAAEAVLIERGHAEAYGRALLDVVATPELADKEGKADPALFAALATAPLDARVRAMAAVIEKLEGTEA